MITYSNLHFRSKRFLFFWKKEVLNDYFSLKYNYSDYFELLHLLTFLNWQLILFILNINFHLNYLHTITIVIIRNCFLFHLLLSKQPNLNLFLIPVYWFWADNKNSISAWKSHTNQKQLVFVYDKNYLNKLFHQKMSHFPLSKRIWLYRVCDKKNEEWEKRLLELE